MPNIHILTQEKYEILLMIRCAKELAMDKALYDPSDDDILIAAAELAEVSTDLAKLAQWPRDLIVAAYDNAV